MVQTDSRDQAIRGTGKRGKMNLQKRKMRYSLVVIILGIRICAMIKKDASNFRVLYAAPKGAMQ